MDYFIAVVDFILSPGRLYQSWACYLTVISTLQQYFGKKKAGGGKKTGAKSAYAKKKAANSTR